MASYKDFRSKAKKRRNKLFIVRLFIVLFLIALFLVIAALTVDMPKITDKFTQLFGEKNNASSQDTTSSVDNLQTTAPDVTQTQQPPTPQDVSFNGLVYMYPRLITENTVKTPDYRMLSALETQKVDISYFADAIFVGDSLADGFRVYLKDELPETARYCTAKGVTPMSLVTGTWDHDGDGVQTNAIDDISATPAGKIYIHLGINSLQNNQSDDVIVKYYAMLIDEIQKRQPTAIIYLQALTPVRDSRINAYPDRYGLERVKGLNNALAAMATEKGAVFLNIREALDDANGFLIPEYGGGVDGIHMNKTGYLAWLEYLSTHTVSTATNPYV